MIGFRAAKDISWDDVRVVAVQLNHEGRIHSIAKPAVFEMQEYDYKTVVEPTFRFTDDEARNLMTALWEAGIRPAGVSSPSAEINRLSAHLEDMRKLVFNAPR